MKSLIEFQFYTVYEFVKQVIEGNIILTIEEKDLDGLDKKVREWIVEIYKNDFDLDGNKNVQDLTRMIFEKILFLRLTGRLTGILSAPEFGRPLD
ncbi:MAG: hypothetical protein M3162_07200 [Thermoproteota archaeon]|nr:hypothetical protein [Thermoproteota archaeon]